MQMSGALVAMVFRNMEGRFFFQFMVPVKKG